MTPVRRFWGFVFVGALLVGTLVMGCQSPSTAATATKKYDQLVRQALAQAQARPDTSFFWLTNTGTPEARSLMLDLGIDYLRYDREADVLCVWAGGWVQPAEGYVTAPTSNQIPADSVAALCTVEGPCSVDSVMEDWSRFQCE